MCCWLWLCVHSCESFCAHLWYPGCYTISCVVLTLLLNCTASAGMLQCFCMNNFLHFCSIAGHCSNVGIAWPRQHSFLAPLNGTNPWCHLTNIDNPQHQRSGWLLVIFGLILHLHFSHLFLLTHSVAQLMVKAVVLYAAPCAHMQLAVLPSRNVKNGLLLYNLHDTHKKPKDLCNWQCQRLY